MLPGAFFAAGALILYGLHRECHHMSEPAMTAAHVERETLIVDVNLPEHTARGGATAIFVRTRKLAIDAAGGRCRICRLTAEEVGHPLEAHHCPIERCFAEAGRVDWPGFIRDARAGLYGPKVASFDWASFDPARWETFVDDMRYNGLVLCKPHHTGADEGIHYLPGPIFLAQGFAPEGVQFNHLEKIHRDSVIVPP